MEDKIYQIYTRKFIFAKRINTFLRQFPKGELKPINVEITGDSMFTVYFITTHEFTAEALLQYKLQEV